MQLLSVVEKEQGVPGRIHKASFPIEQSSSYTNLLLLILMPVVCGDQN
jgi:hypothetical protein